MPETPRAAALVCHPHPAMGGTMHHPIAYRIAQALTGAGVAALRFNFRGVGASTGRYDEGSGELEDAREVLAWLEGEFPGLPLWLAGYSFGAWVAMRLAAEEARISRVLAVGLPVRMFGFERVADVRIPLAVIQADGDEYGSVPEVERVISASPAQKRVFVLENADHVAAGRLKAFERVAEEAVRWLADV